MPRTPISLLCLSCVLLACSGTETAPERPATDAVEVPAPEVTEPAPAAPEVEASECERDTDCVLFAPCCECPPRVIAVNDDQLQRERSLCQSARCSPCTEPGESMDGRMAHCDSGQCAVATVMQGSLSAGPVCESDADCAVHTSCCQCPPVPTAMHVDDIRANQESCSRRLCSACDQPARPGATGAACHEGTCVSRL